MTIRFERGVLVAVGSLAVGLVSAVVSIPLEPATAAPKASLRLAVSAAVPPPTLAETKSPHKGASAAPGAGVDTITGTFSMLLPTQRYWTRLPAQTTAQALSETFREFGYDLKRVRAGEAKVPRLFLASLPGDLKDVRETAVRKSLFFKTVLPLVLQVNEEILRDRRRLWKIHYHKSLGERIGPADRLWLTVVAERYGVERDDIEGLLKLIDVIPPSMALAQAAEESGWGTSRFVQEGNAVFGQWTYSDTGSLVPARRGDDKFHKIKAFSSLHESVRAYAMNLNTHRAYNRLREVRASLRTEGAPLDGYLLAENLTNYSERGEAYVVTIKALIELNKLRHLDDARLGDEDSPPTPVI
jgi:Bax protein